MTTNAPLVLLLGFTAWAMLLVLAIFSWRGGGGAGGGGGAPPPPAARGPPGRTPPRRPPRAHPPPANPPPAMLTGRIVRAGDADYDLARANYNGRFSLHPQLLVFAATADDVANAIRWAREKNVPLRARSGRHSYEAYSLVDDGLVLDVSAMNTVALDAAARTARIGPGCTLMSLPDQLFAGRLAPPPASCNPPPSAGAQPRRGARPCAPPPPPPP